MFRFLVKIPYKFNGYGCLQVENNLRTLKLSGHVGFDNLPDQLVNKSVQNGFIFNILCIGKWLSESNIDRFWLKLVSRSLITHVKYNHHNFAAICHKIKQKTFLCSKSAFNDLV